MKTNTIEALKKELKKPQSNFVKKIQAQYGEKIFYNASIPLTGAEAAINEAVEKYSPKTALVVRHNRGVSTILIATLVEKVDCIDTIRSIALEEMANDLGVENINIKTISDRELLLDAVNDSHDMIFVETNINVGFVEKFDKINDDYFSIFINEKLISKDEVIDDENNTNNDISFNDEPTVEDGEDDNSTEGNEPTTDNDKPKKAKKSKSKGKKSKN